MKNGYPAIIIPLLLLVTFGIFFNVVDTTKEVAKEKPAKEAKTEQVASIDGEAIYKQSCVSCHGEQYQGVVGPKLTGLSDKYDQAAIADILKNGKGGMPGGLVPSEEAAMADWLLTLK